MAVIGSGLSPVPPGLRNIPGQIIDTSKSHQARNKTPWRATDGWTVSLSDCLCPSHDHTWYCNLEYHITCRAFLNSFFNSEHKSPAAVGGEVARNQALKISRLFHEKIKTMVEIKLYQQQNGDTCFIIVIIAIIHCKVYLLSIKNCRILSWLCLPETLKVSNNNG